jgi:hypothetical protein
MALLTSVCAVVASCVVANALSGAGTSLDPVQPIILPDGAMAKNPLAHVGANGPWTAGIFPTAVYVDRRKVLITTSTRCQRHLIRDPRELLR